MTSPRSEGPDQDVPHAESAPGKRPAPGGRAAPAAPGDGAADTPAEPDVPAEPRGARAGGAPAEDPVVITPCPNGPLLVRGDVLIAPEPGAEPQKPPRRVVALCRCNMSSIAPFCDGSHKLANFRTRPPRYNIGSPREDAGEED